ncbi:variable surface protein, partial [Plasmodium gonderi]
MGGNIVHSNYKNINYNIYELVNKFYSRQKIIEGYDEQYKNTYQTECNAFNENFSQNHEFNDENICYKSMYYLNEIQRQYHSKEDSGCIYLYYWIYDNCKGKCAKTKIIDIYIYLINKYKEQNDPVCTEHEENSISKYEFDKLKDIYDIKKEHTDSENYDAYCNKFRLIYMKRKDECDYKAHSDFCNALE